MEYLRETITSRRNDPSLIRLLKTTECVEYWFLLYYERVRPAVANPAEKEQVLKELQRHVPAYKKKAKR